MVGDQQVPAGGDQLFVPRGRATPKPDFAVKLQVHEEISSKDRVWGCEFSRPLAYIAGVQLDWGAPLQTIRSPRLERYPGDIFRLFELAEFFHENSQPIGRGLGV